MEYIAGGLHSSFPILERKTEQDQYWKRVSYETVSGCPTDSATSQISFDQTDSQLATEMKYKLHDLKALLRNIWYYRRYPSTVKELVTSSIVVLNDGISICRRYANREKTEENSSERDDTNAKADGQITNQGNQDDGQLANQGNQVNGQLADQGIQVDGQITNQDNRDDGQLVKNQGIQADGQLTNQGNQVDGQITYQGNQDVRQLTSPGIQVNRQLALQGNQVEGKQINQGNNGQQNNQKHKNDDQVTNEGNKEESNQGGEDDDQKSNQNKHDDEQPNKTGEKEFLDELLMKYNQLLADLKSLPVNFIHTIKKVNKKGVIVVKVRKAKAAEVRGKIETLPNFEVYGSSIEIVECAPSKFLMQNDQNNLLCRMPNISDSQFNIRVGSGSLIAVVSDDQIEEILRNKNARTLQEVVNIYSIPSSRTGTLTCLAKYKGQFYAMTSQHVVDIHYGPCSGQKQIITQVHYESRGLQLADIVHLTSSYYGFLGTVPVGNSKSAVDVTLLPIAQTCLDASSLTPLQVFTRGDSHGPDSRQNAEDYLQDREVMKRGGTTGITMGKIEYPYLQDSMDPTYEDTSQMGDMFGVVGLGNTPFAKDGDSGSIVTIKIIGPDSIEREYALGIISKIDAEDVVLCVRMEDCLKALESVDIGNERIKSSEMEIYTGFLKPLVSVYNRKRPHVELPH